MNDRTMTAARAFAALPPAQRAAVLRFMASLRGGRDG